MPQCSKAQWDALGRLNIDPLSAEDMGNLAALLHVNQNRIYEAIDSVGPRIADIQKWLKDNPPTVKAAEVAAVGFTRSGAPGGISRAATR